MKNEKLNTLNNYGLSTEKYFSLNLPKGLKPGSTITLTISEDGNVIFDKIAKAIEDDGYVANNHLFRRFVMAQMFKMLNWRGFRYGDKTGYDGYLNTFYGYAYQYEMMGREIHALAKMEAEGGKDFEIRKSFFTKEIIAEIMLDYEKKLCKEINSRTVKHCQGRPYINFAGEQTFCNEIYVKYVIPVRRYTVGILCANTYKDIDKIYGEFMKNAFKKLPWQTAKSSTWKSTFKGEGAYYTLQNLIRFHKFQIFDSGHLYKGAKAEEILEQKRREYDGAGYKLFAFMKAQIEYNQFDFGKRMAEIYANK